jgi:hypothetical protein
MNEARLVASSGQSLKAIRGSPGQARVIPVFVLDGLRPDALDPVDTPPSFGCGTRGCTTSIATPSSPR